MFNVLHVYVFCKKLHLGKVLQNRRSKIKVVSDNENEFEELI
jgi:hypothetical protein